MKQISIREFFSARKAWLCAARRLCVLAIAWALSLSAVALMNPALLCADTVDSIGIRIQPKDIWPPVAITDLAVNSISQGAVLLDWTAPKEDNLPLPKMNPVFGYTVRYATFSASDLGVSELTWFNLAHDFTIVGAQNPGQHETDGISNLEPGATLYFIIRSSDNAGNVSPLSPTATAQVVDIAPNAPSALSASLLGATSSYLSWTAPFPNPGDLDFYRIYVNTSTPAQWIAVSTVSAVQTTFTVTGLNLALPTSARVTVVDKGFPNYLGLAMESAASNIVVINSVDVTAPAPVSNLQALADTLAGQRVILTWNNPADLDFVGTRILISTSGFAASVNDVGFTSVNVSSGLSMFQHNTLTANVTYFYSLFTFDLSSNFSTAVTVSTMAVNGRLSPPAQVGNLRGKRLNEGQNFQIDWDPVTKRENGLALAPGELASYIIYRMIILGATDQTYLQSASTGTQFIDAIQNKSFFYKIHAQDINGLESADSDIISSGIEGNTLVLMQDGISFIEIESAQYEQLKAAGLSVSGERQLTTEGGVVFKAMDLKIKQHGAEVKNFIFQKPIRVAIGYTTDGSGVVKNGAPTQNQLRRVPKEDDVEKGFSIYWNSGAQWMKLGTSANKAEKTVSVQSRQTGSFQVRMVDQAFIQQNAVYPRTITPNGDGINDVAFFFFENKTRAEVQGWIYDMKNASVADLKTTDLFAGDNSVLTWDGKNKNGEVVTGGIYLYKIQISGRTFTGSLVVAR